ncbi:MAG: molecular chaperone GroEL [Epsilonproteobacteria bacterium]|nr:MAG: molecular chaperone GroEL [Campylobacterota bacterium]
MSQGYSPKDLVFDDKGRSKLINGISKIAKAVKSTLGPRGNTVLIESPEHTASITVTKDGVTVAKSISLIDPVENLAVKMMKQAADRTATSAGDGTTTAIVLTEAFVKSGTELITDDVNRTEVLRHIVDETKKISKTLKKKGQQVNGKKLKDVAIISANNDSEVGTNIADIYEKVGKGGIVTVEKSKTPDTHYEVTKGIQVKRGWSSHLFINDHKHDECILEDVKVLVADVEITNILQIENILKPIIQNGHKLLIIAPCSQNVINTLAANVMKNNLKLVNIPPPDFGYRQHELMNDIALSVDATYFSEKTGDDLSLINATDLGHCSKVIVGRDSTVVIKNDTSENQEAVEKRVAELWDAHENATRKDDKSFIEQRIASLTGGIGVVHVGGSTDIEQKELYDRVDDAVCAVKSALEEGILPGGGLTLYNIHKEYESKSYVEKDHTKKIAYAILASSLKAPLTQILENAGLDVNDIYKDVKGWMYGYDVKKNKYGYLMKLGVIDPVKVTRSALQNAVSVAVTILSTNAIVTMARSYESSED